LQIPVERARFSRLVIQPSFGQLASSLIQHRNLLAARVKITSYNYHRPGPFFRALVVSATKSTRSKEPTTSSNQPEALLTGVGDPLATRRRFVRGFCSRSRKTQGSATRWERLSRSGIDCRRMLWLRRMRWRAFRSLVAEACTFAMDFCSDPGLPLKGLRTNIAGSPHGTPWHKLQGNRKRNSDVAVGSKQATAALHPTFLAPDKLRLSSIKRRLREKKETKHCGCAA